MLPLRHLKSHQHSADVVWPLKSSFPTPSEASDSEMCTNSRAFKLAMRQKKSANLHTRVGPSAAPASAASPRELVVPAADCVVMPSSDDDFEVWPLVIAHGVHD